MNGVAAASGAVGERGDKAAVGAAAHKTDSKVVSKRCVRARGRSAACGVWRRERWCGVRKGWGEDGWVGVGWTRALTAHLLRKPPVVTSCRLPVPW